MRQRARELCTFPKCSCRDVACSQMATLVPPLPPGHPPRPHIMAAPMLTSKELVDAIGKPCPYCSEAMVWKNLRIGFESLRHPTRDHIKPLSRGGADAKWNIAIVCERCNRDKGNRPLLTWHAELESAGDSRARHVAWVLAERVADNEERAA